MYNYADKPSKEFESESLPRNVVPESDLSLVLIVNNNQQVVFHQGFDQENDRFVRFKLQDPAATPLWKSLTHSFSPPEQENLIALTELGPLVTISVPIMHSDGKGPMNGRVVMGRLTDRSFIQRIGAAIQEKTTLLTPAGLQKELAQNELQLLSEQDFYYKESENFLSVYTPVPRHGRASGFYHPH